MNVRIVQLNLPFKICISVNLYEIDFKYKDECKDCSAKPSLQN